MPTITTGKRKKNGNDHLIVYAGKESLLTMLDESAGAFLNLLEEAARHGWVEPDFLSEFDDDLLNLAMKHNLLQT